MPLLAMITSVSEALTSSFLMIFLKFISPSLSRGICLMLNVSLMSIPVTLPSKYEARLSIARAVSSFLECISKRVMLSLQEDALITAGSVLSINVKLTACMNSLYMTVGISSMIMCAQIGCY